MFKTFSKSFSAFFTLPVHTTGNLAPRKSTPSVNMARASGRTAWWCPARPLWAREGPLFQPLGQHPQPGAIKIQNLQSVVPPITKHVERSTFRIFPSCSSRRRKPVEAFAHVTGVNRHEHLRLPENSTWLLQCANQCHQRDLPAYGFNRAPPGNCTCKAAIRGACATTASNKRTADFGPGRFVRR